MTDFCRLRRLAFLFVTLSLIVGPRTAMALDPGWDVLQVFSDGSDGGTARLLAYDRDAGRAALFDQGYTGFDRALSSQKDLRKSWGAFLIYNQNNILTYDRALGEIDINYLDNIGGRKIKTYEFHDRNWDSIFPINYPDGDSTIYLYDKDIGVAAAYGIDKRNGMLRMPPVVEETLGAGWDIVVPFTLEGSVNLLLYNREGGRAVIRPLPRGGTLGAPTYASSGWRPSWHAVEVFYGDPFGARRPHLLFYDKAAGVGEAYAINTDGTVGALTSRDARWGGNWDFVGVAHQGKSDPAFATLYDRTSGAVAIYALTDDGKIGKRFK